MQNNIATYKGKYLCVFGCLLSDEGKRIKDEMLAWLKPEYHVFCVNQTPPGVLYEYPAIKSTCALAIDTQHPVLYIHTKGAAHINPIQAKVRNMWRHEFSGGSQQAYFNCVNTDEPTVATPLASSNRVTWLNAWVINTAAAALLQDTLQLTANRYYYEGLFESSAGLVHRELRSRVVGIIDTHVESADNVWSYVNKF